MSNMLGNVGCSTVVFSVDGQFTVTTLQVIQRFELEFRKLILSILPVHRKAMQGEMVKVQVVWSSSPHMSE